MTDITETKHTPGPWKMVSATNFDSGLTYVSVQPVTADPVAHKPLAMANGEYHVCRMSHTAARHRIALYEANALLAAAAPDLLEACRLLIGADGEGMMFSERVNKARHAIAKAEGRS